VNVLALNPETMQVGTKAAGFRIVLTPGGTALRLESWGYWSPDLALAFSRDVIVACRKVSSPLSFVLDATELKPQGREGQEALRTLMRCLAQFVLASATISTKNILTKMQLTRLAKDCGVESLLQITDQPGAAWPRQGEP
jgi:hypothetical protein